MLIISRCIFDSVEEEPFEGYIKLKEGYIEKVIKGKVPAKLLEETGQNGEEIIFCGNKTVIPAFCDNHVHVFLAALDLATCNLSEAQNEEDAAQMLSNFYKERDDEWVISFGWCHYDWDEPVLPKKVSLDRYFPDRPVLAVNDELHALWVNSKALEICSVDKNTPDPEYAMIERDENGEPTGYILEQAAMTIFTEKAFTFTEKEERKMVLDFIKKAHSVGVTSVGDMEIIGVAKHELFRELEKEGTLPLRIFFSPSIFTDIEKVRKFKREYISDNLSLLGAKGFIDGTPLGYTGMLVDGYEDRPEFFGEPVLDLKWLKDRVQELNSSNIPVRLHACGDGAVRTALDYIEAGNLKRRGIKLRNSIEHVENIHENDLHRFEKTGTVASIQPYHMSMNGIDDHPIFKILGKKRSELAWPAKSLKNCGARVALGTDCPIVPLDPFKTMFCAVNRVMEDWTPKGGWNPKEKYTLAEAIKGCTSEVAYLLNMEDRIGTLEDGKLADIVILSDNIFDFDPLHIEEIVVDKTIFNGNIVYDRLEDKQSE